MVLRRATSLRGALEGVGGPENWDFFGPFRSWRVPFGPTPSNAPSNDVAALKTIKYKRHKNNRYIGSFMYPSAVLYCCSVVVCKRGGEVSLQLCCVSCEEVLRGWGVVGRLSLPLPLYCRYPWKDARGGGGCYSYIRFDPSLAVSWLAHTTHSWDLTIAAMAAPLCKAKGV